MIIQFIISETNFPDHAPEVATHQEKTLSQTYSVEGNWMCCFVARQSNLITTANELLDVITTRTQYHTPGLLAIATKGKKSLDV